MYSILIKTGSKSFEFDASEETGVFTGNEAETKARYLELLAEYPSSKLIIVHNVEVTSELTLTDVTE